MAELKTKKNDANVNDFLDRIKDPHRRADCRALAALMEKVTQQPPAMWGKSIVGFGSYHYRYASGREGRWFLVGFASRKRNLTVYLMSGLQGLEPILQRLGRHTCGKGCLYLKQLDDHDPTVLHELIKASVVRLQTH